MKALILAALLALAPVSSVAAQDEPTPSVPQATTPKEEQILANVSHIEAQCIAVLSEKKSAAQVAQEDKLDTPEKKETFVTECIILQDAYNVGQESVQKQDDPTT